MKVLVTGGSGWIGKHVLAHLEKRHELINFDLVEPELERCRFVRGDLTLFEDVLRAVEGVEAIIHLGAIPIDTGEANKIWDINCTGTFHVLEAAAQRGVKRLVYASSICAVGFIFWKKPFVPDYFPVDEEHPLKPDDSYGLSKLVGEKLCYAYTRRYGIASVCLRLGPVWFPEIRPSTKMFLEGIEEPAKNKDMIWSYVDVRDVVQAIRLSLEKVSEGWHVYNVGAEDVCSEVSFLELVRRYYPEVELIRNIDGFLREPRKALWDISKAKRELGYSPQHSWKEYVAK